MPRDSSKALQNNLYLISAFKKLLEIIDCEDTITDSFLSNLELLNNDEVTFEYVVAKLSNLDSTGTKKFTRILDALQKHQSFRLDYHDFFNRISEREFMKCIIKEKIHDISISDLSKQYKQNRKQIPCIVLSSVGIEPKKSDQSKDDEFLRRASLLSEETLNAIQLPESGIDGYISEGLFERTDNLAKEKTIILGLKSVLSIFKSDSNLGVLDIFLQSKKYRLSYYWAKFKHTVIPNFLRSNNADEDLLYYEHRYKFYRLIYTLLNYGIIKDTDSLLLGVDKQDPSSDIQALKLLDQVNKNIAVAISKGASELKYYHKKQLKRVYVNWDYATNDNGVYLRFYINRQYEQGFSRYKKPDDKDYVITAFSSEDSQMLFDDYGKCKYQPEEHRKSTKWQKVLKAQ